jgi:hypothetical protein
MCLHIFINNRIALQNIFSHRSRINSACSRAKLAASLYWTPGYILLANVYQELSLYGKQIFSENWHSTHFFNEALQALQVAQKLV